MDDDAEGSTLEVDRISFSSILSSPEDLYMSVGESPCDGFVGDDTLSLSSQHPDGICSTTLATRLDSLLESNGVSSNTDVEDEDPFMSMLPSPSWLDPLPPIIREPPHWFELQELVRTLRKADADVSADWDESNVGIYSASLALCALEEARWINDVSKDPILSRLVNEIDPLFPLAVRATRVSQERSPVLAYPDPDVDRCSSEESLVRSSRAGVDEMIFRTKMGPQWHSIAAHALQRFIRCFDESRAFAADPVRDPRVARWMDDMTAHFEKLLSVVSNDVACAPSELFVEGSLVRLRGSSTWAPPRDGWRFICVRLDNPIAQLKEQNNRCAGCGMKVENEYSKRVRFCEYFGKLFCHCCHQGAKFVIPAKILSLWNFNEFSVSDRAFRFLSQAKDQPAIHILTAAPELVNKITILKRVIIMREKLGHMWQFVKTCRVAEETVTYNGNLKTLFTSLERHLLQSSDAFSLSDLQRVHNKDMNRLLEPIVYYGKCHIEGCQDCQAHAFVCSLCSDATDLLFPFQMDKVVRCLGCGSLSHAKCESKHRRQNPNSVCPKCERLKLLRDRQRVVSCNEEK